MHTPIKILLIGVAGLILAVVSYSCGASNGNETGNHLVDKFNVYKKAVNDCKDILERIQ